MAERGLENLVKFVELETLKHDTESLDKVVRAFKNMLPPELRDKLPIAYEIQFGYYDNIVVIVKSFVRDRASAIKILQHLANVLDKESKQRLRDTLNLRVDAAGTLYIRVNKQRAFEGRAVIDDGGDVIRIKVGFTLRAKKVGIDNVLRKLGLLE